MSNQKNKYDPMDDVPKELEVKGVIGKRISSLRFYSRGGFKLRVEYEFELSELHEVDAARYYPLPEKKICISCGNEYEFSIDEDHQLGYCGSVCHYIDMKERKKDE